MSQRWRRIALLLTVLAGAATGAIAQSTAGGPEVSDALPKHPIPYRAFKKIGQKPKAKPKVATPAPGANGAPGAAGATAPPASVKPEVEPPPKPQTAPPAPATPAKAAPAAPKAAVPPRPVPVPAPVPPTKAPPVVAAAAAVPPPVKLAPVIQAPPPLAVPPTGARLALTQALPVPDLEAFVDGQVLRAMTSDHIAGAAVAVVQDGQLILEKGYGQNGATPDRKLDPRRSIVRLGSGSQIFTWIAALRAVENGKLNLDAPVNTYLPGDLKLPDEGFERPILVRHLMSHSAGFEDRAFGRRFVLSADRLLPLEEALRRDRPRRVRATGVLSAPTDYDAALAGAAVANAQGRPFDQLIETQILDPLALSHTSFREPYPAGGSLPDPLNPQLAGVLATGFHWSNRGWEPQPMAFGQSLAPALSASTTADDMARLMMALLNGGKLGTASIFNPQTSALFDAPLQQIGPGLSGFAHGMAMRTFPTGVTFLSEPGEAPGFRSNVFLAPRLHLGVFVVANTDTGGVLASSLPDDIVQRFYGSAPQSPPAAHEADTQYEGSYLSAQRAYHGLEAFADRLTRQSELDESPQGDLVVSAPDGERLFSPTATPDHFRSADGEDMVTPLVGDKAQAYILGSGQGSAERTGGVHSFVALSFWAAVTGLTVLASFSGLFIRDRIDPRETRAQITANLTQLVTCVLWCVAFGLFAMFAQHGLTAWSLMFDWPNRWLVGASWAALAAALASLLMITQLPGAWREERRIHGWSVWRKIRHTATLVVFLIFTGVLAAWGMLEPWSS